MAKVMIWPDIYREQGHWLPCIALAKSLKDATYTVEFMGIPDTQAIVTPYKATFRTILADIYPVGYSVENKLEPLDQRWKPAHLLPIAHGALNTIFTGAGAPNLLVSGYFTALETLLIHYKYGIPFVIITTFLRHPEERPSLHAKTKLLYMPRAVARAIIDAVVPAAQKGMSIADFVKPLDAKPEIIPCAKDFDFTDPDWKHRSNVKYVEPMIQRATLDGTPLVLTPPPPVIPQGKRLIFGTSGSQVQDYESQARQLFVNLISMMQTQGMDGYQLVLATGEKLDTQLRHEFGMDVDPSKTFPPGVVWYPWVSQLDIVRDADVVFMHGGLATIKESIWEKVPIVIVPHGKDQMDNALRVRRTGVGVVSQVAELAPLDLRRLLTEATSSTWIRQNLAKMQGLFAVEENKPAAQKASVVAISGVVGP
jgi:UDP:flavonoid glycosyltransferase YjiC (YdhE family)